MIRKRPVADIGTPDRRHRIISKVMWLLLTIAVAFTSLIQLPEMRQVPVSKAILMGLWAFLLIASAIVGKIRRSKTIGGLLFCAVVFDLYSIVLDLIKSSGYTTSPLFYNFNMSFFFLLTGYLLANVVDSPAMIRVCKAYALTVLALTPYFVKNYFLTTQIFRSKNSLGPIMVFAAIILVVLFQCRSRFGSLLKWTGVLWLVLCVFLSINRASMASLVVLTLYYVFFCLSKRKHKLIAAGIILVLLAVCLCNSAVSDMLTVVTKLDLLSSGMDEFSRGRLSIMADVEQQFFNSPIVGVGELYVENFHMSVLVQVGLLGCIPVFLVYLYPAWAFVLNRRRVRTDVLARAIALMTVHGLMISVFEEQAPFGQGTAYFMLWLMIGYYVANSMRRPLPALDGTLALERQHEL